MNVNGYIASHAQHTLSLSLSLSTFRIRCMELRRKKFNTQSLLCRIQLQWNAQERTSHRGTSLRLETPSRINLSRSVHLFTCAASNWSLLNRALNFFSVSRATPSEHFHLSFQNLDNIRCHDGTIMYLYTYIILLLYAACV